MKEKKKTSSDLTISQSSSLQKLWLVLSLILLVFVLSAHGETQGSDLLLKINVLVGLVFRPDTSDAIVAMWSIIIVSLLTAAANYVATLHADQVAAVWEKRYPFRMMEFDPATGIGEKIQKIAFCILTVVPLLSLIHFWRVFSEEGKLCVDPSDTWVEIPTSTPFTLPTDWTFGRIFSDTYRLAGEEAGCGHATSYFPVSQPLVMVALTLVAAWCFGRLLFLLFRSR